MNDSLKEKALECLQICRRKAARARAWFWAEEAVRIAREMGLDVPDDVLGTDRWPELERLEKIITASSDYLIISRHQAALQWLAEQGVTGEVVSHVSDPAQVRGRHVVGNIPYYLAAEAATVSVVEMPGMPPEKRGVELSIEEMKKYGVKLARYQVVKL